MADADLDSGCLLNKKIRNAQLAQYNFILGEKSFCCAEINKKSYLISMPQSSDMSTHSCCSLSPEELVQECEGVGKAVLFSPWPRCEHLLPWCFSQWLARRRRWLTAWMYAQETTKCMESSQLRRFWPGWPCSSSHVAGMQRRCSELKPDRRIVRHHVCRWVTTQLHQWHKTRRHLNIKWE